MARKSPIDTLKSAARGGLKAPGAVAAKAVDQVGKVAGAGAGVVTSLVPGLKHGASAPAKAAPATPPAPRAQPAPEPRKDQGDPILDAKAAKKPAAKKPAAKKSAPTKTTAKKTPAKKAAAKKAPAKKSAASQAAPEPVNVTEELGLDPAPVDTPADTATGEAAPVTSIDAQADADDVHVTPADVADAMGSDTRPGNA